MKEKLGFLIISDKMFGAEHAAHNIISNLINKKAEVVLFTNEEILPFFSNIPKLKIESIGKVYGSNNVKVMIDGFLPKYNLSSKVKEKKIVKWIRRFYDAGNLMVYDVLVGLVNNVVNINKIAGTYKPAKKLLDRINENKIQTMIIFSESAMRVYSNIYKKARVPFILSMRGAEIRLYNSNNLIKRLRNMHTLLPLNKLIKNSKVISSNHSWQLDNIRKKYPNKIRVIPNGVESSIFKPLKVKKENNVILFAGRYIEWKGVRELISVAHALPEYEFWFVGKGPLDKLIKGSNIKNLGFKTQKELAVLYNRATICVFPSYHEPFGNVALEAISCGKPVIVTKKGFSEYIENGKDGIIIPAKNTSALKGAILHLMKNKTLREKLSVNAIKKSKKFNWIDIAQQYLEMCKSIIKNK